MDDSGKTQQPVESQWCLVGNIVEQRPYGEGGRELRRGTKHFGGGTKVYCLPSQWGDGYEQIIVIGRHRGSKRLTTMIIKSEWVTNWRANVVYDPEVLRRLKMATRESWQRNWNSKADVELFLQSLNQRSTRKNVGPTEEAPSPSNP